MFTAGIPVKWPEFSYLTCKLATDSFHPTNIGIHGETFRLNPLHQIYHNNTHDPTNNPSHDRSGETPNDQPEERNYPTNAPSKCNKICSHK